MNIELRNLWHTYMCFPDGTRRQNDVVWMFFFNVLTSFQRPYNVVLTFCAGWNTINYFNYSTLNLRPIVAVERGHTIEEKFFFTTSKIDYSNVFNIEKESKFGVCLFIYIVQFDKKLAQGCIN